MKLKVMKMCLLMIALGAGAYHGYCDAQGIIFEKENLELMLTYGPTVLCGTLGGISGVISSGPSFVSRASTSNSSMWIEVNTSS